MLKLNRPTEYLDKKRLLVIGQGPLPLFQLNNTRTNAPGLRTWHFARALWEAGFQVIVVVLDEAFEGASEPTEQAADLVYYSVSSATITQADFLSQLCNKHEPQAVIAASIFPAYLASLYLPDKLPLWADFFGSPLAEGQAKAFVHHDDALIEPYARYERAVARRADMFSTVSSYQRYALVGTLATHGRLNQFSYGYNFVEVVPASLEPEILSHDQSVLRGHLVPATAFVVLWSGGYNTWTDIETLFRGLEAAMATRPDLYFVSTGGSLPAHDELTYAAFQQLIAASSYRERFHLLGWLPFETLHNYYYEADVGIILDKWSYEGVLGSRTRLLDWLKYGLPALTTITAELTETLVQQELAFSFRHEDSAALTALLLRLTADPSILAKAKARASEWVLANFNYAQVCQPLINWARQPRLAPDAGKVLTFEGRADGRATEQQLANLTSQLAQKNTHLAQVERWAHEMETRLKANEAGGGYLKKIIGAGTQASHKIFGRRKLK